MYNKLMRCRSVALIKHNKREHFKSVKSKDIQYLNNLTDEFQYPAAWCAMGENIYLFIGEFANFQKYAPSKQ